MISAPDANAADRVSGFALRLFVLAHALFFSLLLFLACLVAGPARADEACNGKNLLLAMEKDQPAEFAAIHAEAAAVPNGRGVLWRVEKPGVAPSFLFGTMHVADPRVTTLSPAAKVAFDGAATLVIETTDVLDPAKMAAALAGRPDLTMFTDGTTLTTGLSPEDVDTLRKGLAAHGIPLDAVLKMKPWLLSTAVSLPACEIARKAAGAPVLDLKLAGEAKAAAKPVEGLETVISQFEAMAAVPLAQQVQGLVETIKLGGQVDDVIETMVVLYESGDTGLLWPFLHAATPSETAGGDDTFEQTVVTARNHVMAERAKPLLDKGGVFMAVGVLHLPGPEGVVALLRDEGFTVSPGE